MVGIQVLKRSVHSDLLLSISLVGDKSCSRYITSAKDGFKEEDFLKLWKGLHYCLWMQDKPLIQEELSNTLAKLVHELQDADARFLFLHTFFTTEAREWNSLDIWRIDKFMMLMRNVLHELLVLVQKESWSDESVSHLVDIVRETGLHHCKDSIPDGIKIHLADIYMEEVEKVANGKLDGRKLLHLLEPFCNFILKAQNTVLVKRVISRVFEPILTTTANTLKGSNQEEDEEKNGDHYSGFKFDSRLLADRLFKLSLGNECLSRNRPLIYDFVKRLRAVEEGVLPEDEKTDIKPGLNYHDYNDAIQSLTKLHQRERKKQIQHLKKKKKGVTAKKKGDDMNNNKDYSQATNIFTESADSLPGQNCNRRKRKHSQDTDFAVNKQPHIKKQFTSSVPATELNNSFEENSPGSECFLSASVAHSSEINSHDQVKDSPRKRQLSYDLSNYLSSETLDQDNARSANPTEDMSSLKSKTPPSQREISKKASLKGDSDTSDGKFKTIIKVSKWKKKSVWAETPMSDEMEYTGRKGGMESHLLKKESHCNENLSPEGNRSKCEKELKKSPNADNTNSDKNSKLSTSQSTGIETKNYNLDVIQDGEIEIWVPNKKLKTSKIGGSAFAKFEKARLPSAYVKKAFTLTKKQSPGYNNKEGRYSSRTSSLPSKKVQFDMKKNKALAFKDSLHISPVLPFHPDKKPDQGILKSTPEAAAYLKTCPRQHWSSLASEHRSSPAESASTPVTDAAIKQKRSFTRAKATDFFL